MMLMVPKLERFRKQSIGIHVIRHGVKKPWIIGEDIEKYFGCEASPLIMTSLMEIKRISYNINGFLVALNKYRSSRILEFSSDMGSRPVKPIANVSRLRCSQFPQMYRTVKTTDKPAASSGQSDGSGEEDFSGGASVGVNDLNLGRFMDQRVSSDVPMNQEVDYASSSNTTLWSNSSR
ncbi:hypothetical protein IFM89_036677 [Coptis chinensis]|uniref:Uncharacterized protein n=1 Tax=Coptis chinensis TaxID=261450 RepID=A0A835I7A2_9MAGN|nr:hypothetical protein IFM89_036677 [Coptis chinensis]